MRTASPPSAKPTSASENSTVEGGLSALTCTASYPSRRRESVTRTNTRLSPSSHDPSMVTVVSTTSPAAAVPVATDVPPNPLRSPPTITSQSTSSSDENDSGTSVPIVPVVTSVVRPETQGLAVRIAIPDPPAPNAYPSVTVTRSDSSDAIANVSSGSPVGGIVSYTLASLPTV